MRDPFFGEPVIIEAATPGAYRTIVSVSEAAIFMMERWPAEHGSLYRAALQACTGQINTSEEIEMARQAFLAAVQEAGMVVLQSEPKPQATRRTPSNLNLAGNGKRKNRARMEEEEAFLVRFLARETGITEAQARELINVVGTDRSSLLREARLLKGQH
ncbi:DUF982 domain-containing protein [Mesorhizobium huakuii]|uniref:DUF982 domain-containing protein n=1 Tax=Mesorhizobium huakuii TaxID=28104 RepID=A0A7G6SSA3_9HYPH|nr:DUF982 domain-containing protein [Mesorhizobium huakuii]QND57385.1 DUF982 domain-containing protein [Mesorhizobium huakuii]